MGGIFKNHPYTALNTKISYMFLICTVHMFLNIAQYIFHAHTNIFLMENFENIHNIHYTGSQKRFRQVTG